MKYNLIYFGKTLSIKYIELNQFKINLFHQPNNSFSNLCLKKYF